MRIVEQLGYTNFVHIATGGEGDVYTCEKQGAKYIVKTIDALDDEQTELLKRVNSLRNEYFPHIVDIIANGDKTIIIRDYIEGTTLSDEIKKNGSFSYKRAKEVVFDICTAFRVLHSMKPHPIIYRDLKPDNLIITPDGKVKIIDFGIARYHKQESVRDTVLAGTKGYTAPEVMAGMQSDVRSDIYSIGLVFYEILSGKSLQEPPYQIRPIAENNEYIPSYVDEIIAKATDINQTNRYASIDEFVYELENIKEIKAKQKKKKRRRRVFIVLAIVILLSAVFALWILPLLQQPDPETVLDLQFDNPEDAGWLELHGENAEDIIPQEYVKDGVFQLQQEAILKYTLEAGQLFHMRVKPSKISREGTMYFVDVAGVDSFEPQSGSHLGFRFYVGNNQPYTLEPSFPYGYANVILNDSALLARGGEPADIIIWFDDEDNSIRYIISDPEGGEDITYTGVTLDDEYVSERWFVTAAVDTGVWNGLYTGKDLQADIEFIRVSTGPVSVYLEENIPAYEVRKERVDAFLAQTMPLISELDYVTYD